jgi:hypothetical protein
MDDDRRRIIRPREPLTYDQDHTRAGARALRGKQAGGFRFSCDFFVTAVLDDYLV